MRTDEENHKTDISAGGDKLPEVLEILASRGAGSTDSPAQMPRRMQEEMKGQTSLSLDDWIVLQSLQDATGLDIGSLNCILNRARMYSVPAEQVEQICHAVFRQRPGHL